MRTIKNQKAKFTNWEGNAFSILARIKHGEIFKLIDKDIVLNHFKELINSGISQAEQNIEPRKMLNDLKSTTSKRADPQMRFGLNANSLSGIYRKELMEIIESEV